MKCPFEECKQYDFADKVFLYTHLDTRHTGYEVRHKLIELVTANGHLSNYMCPVPDNEKKQAYKMLRNAYNGLETSILKFIKTVVDDELEHRRESRNDVS